MEPAEVERRERFEALFERYHGYVVAFAIRRAPGGLVDDVVGEIRTWANETIEKGRRDGTIPPPPAWRAKGDD